MIIHDMTTEQRAAATSFARLTYVKAGPGSGKTFLASESFGFLRYVRHDRDPRGVVGVTFARSARRELAERIRRRWGERAVGWPNGVHTFDDLHRRLLRHLIYHGHIEWPGGQLPDQVDDSWEQHEDATRQVGQKPRKALSLDRNAQVVVVSTTSDLSAPRPCFLSKDKFIAALEDGACTHTDVRNVLFAALNENRHPELNDAVRSCLTDSICHLVIDEAFDMNPLDARVVERAIEAGVPVTLVGDPWQSLYEFRGSSPDTVKQLVADYSFVESEMRGSFRYSSAEMRELADALFDEKPFAVTAYGYGDEFDVVLAHDWNLLWAESRLPVLPAGRRNKMDGGHLASCFVLLLSEVVRECFGIDTSGRGEACRRFGITGTKDLLAEPLQILRDPASTTADIWYALYSSFNTDGSTWDPPKKIATESMERLKQLVTSGVPPILGLTVHQAKGLEWDRVLLLNGELTTAAGWGNILEQPKASHRGIYVALTRARSLLRVAHVAADPYGHDHAPIGYVRL